MGRDGGTLRPRRQDRSQTRLCKSYIASGCSIGHSGRRATNAGVVPSGQTKIVPSVVGEGRCSRVR
jgi:hypothetical protein